MKCDQIQKMLSAFLEGVLSMTEKAFVEKHTASCEACRAAFEEYQDAQQLIGNLEDVEPPPGFAQKIMARVEEENKKSGILGKLFYPLYIKVPVQAAAAVAVAVLAIQAYRAVEPQKPATPQSDMTAVLQPGEDSGRKKDVRGEAARPEKKEPAAPAQETRIGEGAAKDAMINLPAAPAPPSETQPRKEESAPLFQTPAGPVLAREAEKREGAADGKRAKMEMKAAAPAPSREAASLQKIATFGFALLAEDPARAGEKVQSLLREIGGSGITMNRQGESEIITAELNPERLPLLLDQMKTFGDMSESPRSLKPAAPLVSVRIEIFRK